MHINGPLEKTLMLGKMRAEGEEGIRGWDGWMTSPVQWTWIWANSGIWWWTGRPDVLQSMGSQRVRHDWATEHQQQWERKGLQGPALSTEKITWESNCGEHWGFPLKTELRSYCKHWTMIVQTDTVRELLPTNLQKMPEWAEPWELTHRRAEPGSDSGQQAQLGGVLMLKAGQPTPVLLPGESQGQRSLLGYSPWSCRVGHNWATNTFIFKSTYWVPSLWTDSQGSLGIWGKLLTWRQKLYEKKGNSKETITEENIFF